MYKYKPLQFLLPLALSKSYELILMLYTVSVIVWNNVFEQHLTTNFVDLGIHCAKYREENREQDLADFVNFAS